MNIKGEEGGTVDTSTGTLKEGDAGKYITLENKSGLSGRTSAVLEKECQTVDHCLGKIWVHMKTNEDGTVDVEIPPEFQNEEKVTVKVSAINYGGDFSMQKCTDHEGNVVESDNKGILPERQPVLGRGQMLHSRHEDTSIRKNNGRYVHGAESKVGGRVPQASRVLPRTRKR